MYTESEKLVKKLREYAELGERRLSKIDEREKDFEKNEIIQILYDGVENYIQNPKEDRSFLGTAFVLKPPKAEDRAGLNMAIIFKHGNMVDFLRSRADINFRDDNGRIYFVVHPSSYPPSYGEFSRSKGDGVTSSNIYVWYKMNNFCEWLLSKKKQLKSILNEADNPFLSQFSMDQNQDVFWQAVEENAGKDNLKPTDQNSILILNKFDGLSDGKFKAIMLAFLGEVGLKKRKETLFHEMQHLIDYMKYVGPEGYKKSAEQIPDITDDMTRKERAQAYKEYVNNPLEMEAFFRQGVQGFLNKLKNKDFLTRIKQNLQMAQNSGKGTAYKNIIKRKIIKDIQKNFRGEFWQLLTKDNKQRIQKRLYTFTDMLTDKIIKDEI